MTRSAFWCAVIVPLLLLGCATRSATERELGAEAGANYAIVKVFYATDRKAVESRDVRKKFGGERGGLQYGTANVSIPRNHRMGVLETPSVWKFQFRADPEKHIVLLDLETMDQTMFFESVEARVKRSARKSAFVFVHGYNVTFEDAARRTAQISYDLGFDGAPTFYSWPSQGDTAKYTLDENNVAWSTANLERFLTDFAEKSGAEKIYLIGHSMGTRALTQAYISALNRMPLLRSKFVEVILAAPDIDAEIFKRDIAPAMLADGSKITLYASSEDLALKASKMVHGYARAGDADDILIMNGVESIDASAMNTDFLNHSYFAANRSIIADMFYIVHDDVRARDRAGLQATSKPNGGVYWRFKP